ncbi:TPA: hypothetical protein N0F65_002085 [Lagenidium giganteum]|uniref:Uncharacterized protein n=1 Tax=Lagenidium giganteum TaxID=4803 RepID=A0AAV2ZHQ5_9STRA|nr:TPA: hypothetical protein N0F65_002085 [Lagenidium giganteum]
MHLMNETSLSEQLTRQLHARSERKLGQPKEAKAEVKEASPVPSPAKLKPPSAKLERALQLRDQCDRDLDKFFDAKYAAAKALVVSPTRTTRDKDLSPELEPADPKASGEHAADHLSRHANAHLQNRFTEKSVLERLLRKLSPIKNTATTYIDLVHALHSCADCSARLTFCTNCAEKTTEFFNAYSPTELLALYGRDLPPPDLKDHHSDHDRAGTMASMPPKDKLLRALDEQRQQFLQEYGRLAREVAVATEQAANAEQRLRSAGMQRASEEDAVTMRHEQEKQALLERNERLNAKVLSLQLQYDQSRGKVHGGGGHLNEVTAEQQATAALKRQVTEMELQQR